MTDSTVDELKQLISKHLTVNKEEISKWTEDEPLFSPEGLAFDSIDAMELLAVLQKEYGISIKSIRRNRKAFETLGSLARYIEKNRQN